MISDGFITVIFLGDYAVKKGRKKGIRAHLRFVPNRCFKRVEARTHRAVVLLVKQAHTEYPLRLVRGIPLTP